MPADQRTPAHFFKTQTKVMDTPVEIEDMDFGRV